MGPHTAASAVRKAEACERAGALRSQVAANVIERATLRRATMTATSDGRLRRADKIAEASGPTLANCEGWSSYALALVSPKGRSLRERAKAATLSVGQTKVPPRYFDPSPPACYITAWSFVVAAATEARPACASRPAPF